MFNIVKMTAYIIIVSLGVFMMPVEHFSAGRKDSEVKSDLVLVSQ